jgi:hypothetical protein
MSVACHSFGFILFVATSFSVACSLDTTIHDLDGNSHETNEVAMELLQHDIQLDHRSSSDTDTKNSHASALANAVHTSARKVADRKPKLALLFLTKDRIYNEAAWLTWLARADRDGQQLRLLIHAYGLPQENRSSFFEPAQLRPFLVNETAPSAWCDLLPPMDMLITIALQDPEVTHLAFAGETTLPLKPLSWMHAQLQAEDSTRMCSDSEFNIAELWWVMKRDDAEAVDGQWGNHLGEVGCSEESSFYNGLKHHGRPMLSNCTTFAWFEYMPLVGCNAIAGTPGYTGPTAAWCSTTEKCDCPKLVPPNGESETEFVKLNREKFPKKGAHPVTFLSVSVDAFSELLRSPFWFARKFEDGALSLAEYNAAVDMAFPS